MSKKVTAKQAAPAAKVVKAKVKLKGAAKSAAKLVEKQEQNEKAKKETPAQRLNNLIAQVNTKYGVGTIRKANEANTSHTLRRPTGIPGLDIDGLGGGFPASALSVITAPDGAGKDYILNCVIREVQNNYGEETRVCIYSTEFPYDKLFARRICGVQVALTPEELDEQDKIRLKQGQPALTQDERDELSTQVGHILLVQGVNADDGFTIVLDALRTGDFQVIAINSVGVLETQAKEEKDDLGDHAQQSSEAQLLSRFIPKMFSLLNTAMPDGTQNRTTLLATNQVRANREQVKTKPGVAAPASSKYQPGSGSRALAHGKAIDLMLHKGSTIYDLTVKPPIKLGREIPWETIKGKLGTHDGIKGEYSYFYEEGADVAGDLLGVASRLEVIEASGSWFEWKGNFPFKAQGSDKAAQKLRSNPELFKEVYNACVVAKELVVRYV